MSYLACECGFIGTESQFEEAVEKHRGDRYPGGGLDFYHAVCPKCYGIDNYEMTDAEAHEALNITDEEEED